MVMIILKHKFVHYFQIYMLSNYYTKTEIDDIDDGLSTLILNTYNTSDKYIYIYIYVYLYIYIYIYTYICISHITITLLYILVFNLI